MPAALASTGLVLLKMAGHVFFPNLLGSLAKKLTNSNSNDENNSRHNRSNVPKSNLESSTPLSSSSLSLDADAIYQIISPFENYIINLQKLMIWEDVNNSLIALGIFNISYWSIALLNRTLFSSICIIAFSLYFYQLWVTVIWPEIAVRTTPSNELWTPVHPQVLSAPELSRHLKEQIEGCISFCQKLLQFRRKQHGLFTVMATSFLLTLAYIGCCFRGVCIIYFLLMTMALTPGFMLYVMPTQWKQEGRQAINYIGSVLSCLLNPESKNDTTTTAVIVKNQNNDDNNQIKINNSGASSNVINKINSQVEIHHQSTSSSSSSPSSNSSFPKIQQADSETLQTLFHNLLESKFAATTSKVLSTVLENVSQQQHSPQEQQQPHSPASGQSRRSSQSSSGSGIRFIPAYFGTTSSAAVAADCNKTELDSFQAESNNSSRSSSTGDLTEFEIVSKNECAM